MLTVKYRKTAQAVYISHIDVLRSIIRGVRRAGLDIAYSNGFNPHAELYLSPPLPLFADSLCEYFTAASAESAEAFLEKYSHAAAPGLTPERIFRTVKNPNLAGKIFSTDYLFETDAPVSLTAVSEFLKKENIPFTARSGKEKNMRSYINSLSADGTKILLNSDALNLRPDVAAAEFETSFNVKVLSQTRTAQYVKYNDTTLDADKYLEILQSEEGKPVL
ncbi:MAG: TIGR03936 family radical SAM-associated protein [Clostridiales bacterium]|jgi:radical SAM-linked protein|nr:TIGR03936 family radical SAM-associated protein [Clostridiales bacterium]